MFLTLIVNFIHETRNYSIKHIREFYFLMFADTLKDIKSSVDLIYIYRMSMIFLDNQHAVIPSYWIYGKMQMEQPEHIW